MSRPTVTARTRPIVAGLGVLALAAAACGGASTASTKPASSQSPTTTAPGNTPPPGAFGTAAAVSGSTLEVQNPTTGQVTVNISPSTTFTQTVPATAADLVAGACVSANAGPGSSTTAGQPFTARTVAISQPGANGCTPQTGGLGGFGGARAGNGGAGGGGGGSGTTAPANGPNGNGNGARRFAGAFGKVASVSAPSFVVQGINRNGADTTTTVTTDATTTFTKVVGAAQSNLAVGQCIAATGPSDQTGAVTANSIAIRPPGPNGCFTGRGGPGGPGGGNGSPGSAA
jgi:hypothetical protein